MSEAASRPELPAPLTAMASRYGVLKAEIGEELRARQLASRFGGDAEQRTAGPKQDARREAARRLGAGVSHATLEKVLWLQEVAAGGRYSESIRLHADYVLDQIDDGEPVDWLYLTVHGKALIEEINNLASVEGDHGEEILAAWHLRQLTPMLENGTLVSTLDRQARAALAAIRSLGRRGTARHASGAPAAAVPLVQPRATKARRRRQPAALDWSRLYSDRDTEQVVAEITRIGVDETQPQPIRDVAREYAEHLPEARARLDDDAFDRQVRQALLELRVRSRRISSDASLSAMVEQLAE